MFARLAFALLLLAAPVLADEPQAQSPPAPDEPHVAAFGMQDKTCLEWTDACQICLRKTPEDEVHCSTAGFACVAEKPVCRKR